MGGNQTSWSTAAFLRKTVKQTEKHIHFTKFLEAVAYLKGDFSEMEFSLLEVTRDKKTGNGNRSCMREGLH